MTRSLEILPKFWAPKAAFRRNSVIIDFLVNKSLFSQPMYVLICFTLRPRLYGETLSRVEGSPAYPSYPGRANFSYITLQNLANRLHEKQKVGWARRVTSLVRLPFCDGRVTLLAGPTFLHINTLACLAGSRRDDQSMREFCCYWKVSSRLGQRSQHFSYINAR